MSLTQRWLNQSFGKYLFLFFLCSCQVGGEEKARENSIPGNNSEPLKVTEIASLPDSLKPKVYYLDSMPAPVEVAMSELKSDIRMLPVLENELGNPILDAQGQPIKIGDGGKSHFTSFTTENGLPADWISSSLFDKNGYLWLGTILGLSRYDGRSFLNFTMDQGLVDNNIKSLFEDSRGNLWIGTVNGLSRYDGVSITNFTTVKGLAKQVVKAIREDKHGNIWFGTNDAGVTYLKKDRVRHPCILNTCKHEYRDQQDFLDHNREVNNSFEPFSQAKYKLNGDIPFIYEDSKGILWFGSVDGIYRYDGQTLQNYNTSNGLASNNVSAILEDRSGRLWIGTLDGGVSSYDGHAFTNYNMSNGLASNGILCLAEDNDGNLWFGSTGVGLTYYDGSSFTPLKIGLHPSNTVRTILPDNNDKIWFGTQASGLHRYHGKSFVNFSTENGLNQNTIYTILEDTTGNLWFGCSDAGISVYNEKYFANTGKEHGLSNGSIFSLAMDKAGAIWFGTYNAGVSRFDGKHFTSYTTRQGLCGNIIRSILEDKAGNLWIATNDGGVSRFDGKSFTNFTTKQGLAHNTVRCITKDKNQNLWFGTKNGVSMYNGKSFVNFSIEHGLANEIVWSILEDSLGNMWFGTNNGLCVLSASDVRKLEEYAQSPLKDLNDSSRNGALSIRSFTRTDGLPHNTVPQLLTLADNRIIAGTLNGIAIFHISQDLSELLDISVYNSELGYPIKDVNNGHNALFLDSKGFVWIGTGSDASALVRFDPKVVNSNNNQPRIAIHKIKINDENINWFDLLNRGSRKTIKNINSAQIQNYLAFGENLSHAETDALIEEFGNIQFDSISRFDPLPQNLKLPYEHNNISFEFSAIDPSNPYLIRYQYMLDGHDHGWSPITDHSIANFGNMREGSYTFKVKAKGVNGMWSEPIAFSFRVLPPWYRTWWAYLIYMLLITGSWIGINRYRERNLRKENEKLEKKIKLRTVEVVKEKIEAEKQRQRSDELLINILPVEVAEELKAKGSTEAKQFDQVTVLFTDFTDFTKLSEKLSAEELVENLNQYFSAFDLISQKYKIEKIKTIGDSYMAAGGLPVPNTTHAKDVLLAALEIRDYIENIKATKIKNNELYFDVRIGINTGPLVAGIVGVKKFQYDIWGDTVNVAARMESNSEVGKVNISQSTYEILKNDPDFVFESRGKIVAKGKGEVEMYFAEKRS